MVYQKTRKRWDDLLARQCYLAYTCSRYIWQDIRRYSAEGYHAKEASLSYKIMSEPPINLLTAVLTATYCTLTPDSTDFQA